MRHKYNKMLGRPPYSIPHLALKKSKISTGQKKVSVRLTGKAAAKRWLDARSAQLRRQADADNRIAKKGYPKHLDALGRPQQPAFSTYGTGWQLAELLPSKATVQKRHAKK